MSQRTDPRSQGQSPRDSQALPTPTSPMLFPSIRDADDFADWVLDRGAVDLRVDGPTEGDPFYKVSWGGPPPVIKKAGTSYFGELPPGEFQPPPLPAEGPRRRLDVVTAEAEQAAMRPLLCGMGMGFLCGLFWREIGRLMFGWLLG